MIRRYYATKDNTITNAFEENLTTRGTGSNMGASDIVEVFSIYAQATSASAELARTLIQFDISEISTARSGGQIPASGSVSFYLKMYNAPHSQTTPSNFTLSVQGVSGAWQEGFGIDMDFYEDLTRDVVGSNWIKRSGSTSWSTQGGDFYSDSSSSFTQDFSTGLEDLCVEVTPLVEQWITGSSGGGKDNNGFVVKLTNALEATSKSYFRKKFFGRDSEFYFQRPVLEARWDSSRKDDRGYFFASSSLVSAEDNLNKLYLYNRVRGQLKDYPIAPTSASIRLSSTAAPASNLAVATVGRVSTGIYSASIAVATTASTVSDIWYSGSVGYHTGTIQVKTFESLDYNPEDSYVLSMPGFQRQYRKNQTHRLSLYVREKNWGPNIHTTAVKSSIPSLIIPSASFQLRRCIDDYVVVPYGTGSSTEAAHTGLSYDVSGNYFDLDTTYLEAGYAYDIQYSFYDEENGWEEQPYRFKFRVVD